MTMIRNVLMGLLLLSVSACASKPKSNLVVNTESDRLAKFQRKEVVERSEGERERINKLVVAARKEAASRVRAQFPLPRQINEDTLYAEVLRLNQARNIQGVEYMVEELIKRFPNSVHADNALMVAGQLFLSVGLAAESLKYFEQVLKDYPLSHKHSAALFHKGVAYRRLKLYGYAEGALSEVQRIYPGSPESYRVEMEMQLLKAEQKASL